MSADSRARAIRALAYLDHAFGEGTAEAAAFTLENAGLLWTREQIGGYQASEADLVSEPLRRQLTDLRERLAALAARYDTGGVHYRPSVADDLRALLDGREWE